MRQLVLRAVLGGIVIAIVPWAADRLGPKWGAIAVVVPVVSLTSFAFVAMEGGSSRLEAVASRSFLALGTTAAFMAALVVLLRLRAGVYTALLLGLGTWLLAASVFVTVVKD